MAEKVNRDTLPDIQNTKDDRKKRIERVGIENVQIPLNIARQWPDSVPETVQANISMYASVEEDVKGVNMSRFMETIVNFRDSLLHSSNLRDIIKNMLKRLECSDGYIKIAFKYFISRCAPVSKNWAIQGYNCAFIGRLINGKYDFALEVNVIGTNLCPCSKEISKYGAHNQRNHVRIRLVPSEDLFWIEEIVDLIEGQLSCPIYPLLKREDEKWVTETAYENPKFVEDVSRDIALALDAKNVEHYQIRSSADESIHQHQAVATLSKDWILS